MRVYFRQNVLNGIASPPLRLFLFFAIGKKEKRTGSKSKKITWHNSRREWLFSIRDCISQILIRQLSLARTFVLGAVRASKQEREREGQRENETKRQKCIMWETRARQSERRITLKRDEFLRRCPRAARPRRKWKRGRLRRTKGVALMGRGYRALCCNAKLKQNYLVPLSYGTLGGEDRERLASKVRGYCRRPGAIVSCQGCILTRIKNGCLRLYSVAVGRNCGRVCGLVSAVCRYAHRQERGCFVCRRSTEGQEFIDLRRG